MKVWYKLYSEMIVKWSYYCTAYKSGLINVYSAYILLYNNRGLVAEFSARRKSYTEEFPVVYLLLFININSAIEIYSGFPG